MNQGRGSAPARPRAGRCCSSWGIWGPSSCQRRRTGGTARSRWGDRRRRRGGAAPASRRRATSPPWRRATVSWGTRTPGHRHWLTRPAYLPYRSALGSCCGPSRHEQTMLLTRCSSLRIVFSAMHLRFCRSRPGAEINNTGNRRRGWWWGDREIIDWELPGSFSG